MFTGCTGFFLVMTNKKIYGPYKGHKAFFSVSLLLVRNGGNLRLMVLFIRLWNFTLIEKRSTNSHIYHKMYKYCHRSKCIKMSNMFENSLKVTAISQNISFIQIHIKLTYQLC